mmetsp:Transcript_23402/g.23354  ORF Transcript_23402/g.23354 Transcript_23402/m.23354 type:complete len:162 (-) Transcript_23402:49-534(-)
MVKQFDYQYCINDQQNKPVICFEAEWLFIIGFRSLQFHDEDRFYNLTVTPYATMTANFSLNSLTGPARLSIGPSLEFVHFRLPLSFEVEDKDKFCYAGNLQIDPISILTSAKAEFLECEITIPEETTRCNWDEGVGARINNALLTDGYESTLLDRVCMTPS